MLSSRSARRQLSLKYAQCWRMLLVLEFLAEQKRVELEDMFLNYLVPSIGADIAEILPSED